MILRSLCPACKRPLTIEILNGVESFACACGFRLVVQTRDQVLEVARLRVELAKRDAQIDALIDAGDALGVDNSRPGWQRRWAAWMRAKGF